MSDPARARIDRPGSDLTSQWIAAIVASAAVGFVMGMIAYVIRDAFDLTSPNAGVLATAFLFAIEIVAAVPSFAVYANRTGGILQRLLPALPVLTWYALHVLLGVAVGVVVALTEMGTESAPYQAPEPSLVLGTAFGGVITGALIGAAVGALQALVLRKAARAVGLWVRWSMIGGTTLALFALALYLDTSSSLWSQLQMQVLGFVVAVLAGLALLPAVHRIEPR